MFKFITDFVSDVKAGYAAATEDFSQGYENGYEDGNTDIAYNLGCDANMVVTSLSMIKECESVKSVAKDLGYALLGSIMFVGRAIAAPFIKLLDYIESKSVVAYYSVVALIDIALAVQAYMVHPVLAVLFVAVTAYHYYGKFVKA